MPPWKPGFCSKPQPWREDASNQDLAHTRNRIRWQLMPLLRTFNPQIAAQLARLATISADEEAYWQGELQRLLPALLLPGRPTRGGGRSASTHPEEQTVAMEQVRLRELHPAVARRVLRAAARSLGARLSFEHTEQMLALAGPRASRGGKFDLPGGITVERSLREIRLTRSPTLPATVPAHAFLIPGEILVPEYGVCLRAESAATTPAILRPWKAGDRVTLTAQPGSQESCRGSGPAARGGRGAEKLAGGRVGGKDCLDARGRGGCPWVSVYDFAYPQFPP